MSRIIKITSRIDFSHGHPCHFSTGRQDKLKFATSYILKQSHKIKNVLIQLFSLKDKFSQWLSRKLKCKTKKRKQQQRSKQKKTCKITCYNWVNLIFILVDAEKQLYLICQVLSQGLNVCIILTSIFQGRITNYCNI